MAELKNEKLNEFFNYWDGVIASWLKGEEFDCDQQRILKKKWLNLSRNHMPEPYWGNPEECSIVIANYNPGGGADRNRHAYLKCADWEHTFINEVKKSKYSDVASGFPIIDEPDLNKEIPAWWEDYGGSGWWRDKRDWLEDNIINNKYLYNLLKDIIPIELKSLWQENIEDTEKVHSLLINCINKNEDLKNWIEKSKERKRLWQEYKDNKKLHRSLIDQIKNNEKLHRSLIDQIKVNKDLYDLLKDCIKDENGKIEEYKSKVKKPFAIEFCGWHSKSWPNDACGKLYEDNKSTIDKYFIDVLVEAVKCSDLKLGICIGSQLYELLNKLLNESKEPNKSEKKGSVPFMRSIENDSPEYRLCLYELKGTMILSVCGTGRNRFPKINQDQMKTVRVYPKMQK